MNESPCDRLDDYLGNWLCKEEATRFEAHLSGCPVCPGEIRRQRRINLLLAQGAKHAPPVPSSLSVRIERQVRRAGHRRAAWLACAVSAAVVLVSAVGIGVAMRGAGTPDDPRPVVRQSPKPVVERPEPPRPTPPQPAPPRKPDVQVVCNDPSDAIAVALPTESPNVSIVWIYPTVKPAATRQEPNTN